VPAVEKRSRREAVDARPEAAARVLAKVCQDVNQGIAHGTWTFERARMETIRPKLPAATQCTIHAPSHADRKPLHAARQRLFPRRLHQHMDMVRLNRKLHDAKALRRARRGSAQRLYQSRKHPLRPHSPESGSQRHVQRMALHMRRPRSMCDVRPRPSLPPSMLSRAAPARWKRKRQLPGQLLPTTPHPRHLHSISTRYELASDKWNGSQLM
jgi:hypothetical protein